MLYRLIFSGALFASSAAIAAPLHDKIPVDFQGKYAPTLADCKSSDGVDVVEVTGEAIHYYEGDDYLLLGISFEGASTKSESFIPLFNGRFIRRVETQILGERNARLELEKPGLLIKYPLDAKGEPIAQSASQWLRCPQ